MTTFPSHMERKAEMKTPFFIIFSTFAIASVCLAQASSGAAVDVFYTSDTSKPKQAEIEVWEKIMKTTRLGHFAASDGEINTYLLLDAINVRLKERNSPLFIFFAEPAQSNAGWTLHPLADLVRQIPAFAPQLQKKELSTFLAKKTLWDVYNDIFLGGYGFKIILRPYGILMFNG